MSEKRTISINLAYYKQGDDMEGCLKISKNGEEAFRNHAVLMASVAYHLNRVADMVKDHDVEISADTHMIEITCDEDLAQRLLDVKLADEGFDDEVDEDLEESVDEET